MDAHGISNYRELAEYLVKEEKVDRIKDLILDHRDYDRTLVEIAKGEPDDPKEKAQNALLRSRVMGSTIPVEPNED